MQADRNTESKMKESIPTEEQYNEACEVFGITGLSLEELRNREKNDAYIRMRARFMDLAKKLHPDKVEDKSEQGIAKANTDFNRICIAWKNIDYFISHPTATFTSNRFAKFVDFIGTATLTIDDYKNLEGFNNRISLETIIQKFLEDDKEVDVFLSRFEIFSEKTLRSHHPKDRNILEKYARSILERSTRTARENIFLALCYVSVSEELIPIVINPKKFTIDNYERHEKCWSIAFTLLDLGKTDRLYPYYQTLLYAYNHDRTKRISEEKQSDLFRQVAKNNVAIAITKLALLTKEQDSRLTQLLLAAEAGEVEAMYHLGREKFSNETKKEEGIKWLQKAMRLGSEDAALTLARHLKKQKKKILPCGIIATLLF